MRRVHPLGFDDLEGRRLLSAHVAGAVATAPLVLNGTLNVDPKAVTASEDGQGDVTTATPVTGTLAGLGAVRGLWYESQDAMGDYLGPDSILCRDAQGTFRITFNDASPSFAHKTATGATSHPIPQHVRSGTGAYAKAVENGTIILNTNAARTVTESLTLTTKAR